MTALYIYLAGVVLTDLVLLFMLWRAYRNAKLFWVGVKADKHTLWVLGLFWFAVVLIVGFYGIVKGIGRISYRLSNGKVAKGAF